MVVTRHDEEICKLFSKQIAFNRIFLIFPFYSRLWFPTPPFFLLLFPFVFLRMSFRIFL